MTSVTSDRRHGLNSSAAFKVPCRAATTAAIALSGLQTIDGVVLAAGDRVLVKNQVDQTTNGIYTADTGNWSRDIDADGTYDFVKGSLVFVVEGGTNAGQVFQLTTPAPVVPGTSNIAWALLSAAALISLAAANGSSLVGHSSAGASTVARTVQDKERDIVSIKDWGTTTALVQKAIDESAAAGASLFAPDGTYSAVPATAQVGASNYTTAWTLATGLHIYGSKSAIFKLADNQSTDAAPKALSLFSTTTALSNISFSGVTFDLNGANNKISPARPAVYNRYDMAAITVSGNAARINDMSIENCTFQNTPGVCFVVCGEHNVGSGTALGQRWTIRNNLFLNGGTDTDDHTSVFGFAESILCEGNIFWEDAQPHTVGLTGGATCYEIHGSNQRVVNNYFYNYKLGCYLAGNYTSSVLNSVIANNQFYCSDHGIIIYRDLNMPVISGALIDGNAFYFDNYTYAGQPSPKAAVHFQGQLGAPQQYEVNNIKIQNNYANATGTAVTSNFVRWDTVTIVGAHVCSNISITDNQAIGFTNGVYLLTNAANGQGYTDISRNEFISLTPDVAANPPIAIHVDATGGVTTLVIDGNSFIDERGVPSFAYGTYLVNGTITDLFYGLQTYKGLTTANYTETSAVTNRKGNWTTKGVTGAIATGTAITHNLPAAPTTVLLQAADGTPTTVYPSAIGAAQFTINFAGGGNHIFHWQASIGTPFP